MLIDELLRMKKYDIYNNSKMKDSDIKTLASIIAKNKEINLNEYFSLTRCANKFCWNNFIAIIAKLPSEDKARGIPLLFELLQDSNWPVYKNAVNVLVSIDKVVLMPYVKKYLEQAIDEEDEMWIENIQLLAEKMHMAT